MTKLFGILTFLFFASGCLAQSTRIDNCSTSKSKITPYGEISRTECGTVAAGHREMINVNGIPVLTDVHLYDEDSNKDRSIRVYTSGAKNIETGCAPRLYLLDLSTKPVKVIAFGVKNACNEFHWASWGVQRSVIALKHNVKFTYENGKMILPTADEKLLKTIEPPHSSIGGGLPPENAIPFADDVSIPK